jgi:hypothetical protein
MVISPPLFACGSKQNHCVMSVHYIMPILSMCIDNCDNCVKGAICQLFVLQLCKRLHLCACCKALHLLSVLYSTYVTAYIIL